MKTFLVIAVTNIKTLFIFDTYGDYLVTADTKEGAETIAGTIPHLVAVDEVNEIGNDKAEALMKINRTRKISNSITQIIMF